MMPGPSYWQHINYIACQRTRQSRPQTDPWYLALFKKLPMWLKVVVVILVVLGLLGVGYVVINGSNGAGLSF